MRQIYLVLGDASYLVSNRLINSRLIYLLVIERLRYIWPVSYTHLDVYKRQIVKGFDVQHRLKILLFALTYNQIRLASLHNRIVRVALSLIHI